MADSSAYQLVHRVYDGPVDLAPLRVLDSRTIDWAKLRVTFFVLGASHAVCILGQGVHLTEVLACAAPQTGAHTPVLETPIRRCRAIRANICGIQFSVEAKIATLDYGTSGMGRLHAEVPSESRLDVPFPAGPGRETPWTRIGWLSSPAPMREPVPSGMLWVETVHTYPEETRAVRTVTQFTREDAA